ncbi:MULTISPECIES: N-acetyltransferase [unclassified Variovorax]|jgi:putative acetyltransferase|uniref:GNAT family N-acetyltransferase n=1 Tax=unclassified Variovorax TaxID=663243 RepID=UPI000F7DD157|nr:MULTISPECIES: N-acetyltransferase [unclassified Variovorax]RSZ39624.1 N-acetyltransferase [Variovorax sp. 553]RSZ40671.1 N-acetyltransferase [Variovorax sp. 679]
MSIDIRNEAPADAPAIEAVTAAAFLEAEHSSRTEQFIVNALRRAGQLSVSLVAEDAGRIVGHVAISPVRISGDSPGWYGLGPVSVVPGQQARGIGTRLVNEALAALRGMGASGCVVLGDPAYYGRFGFAATPALVYPGVPAQYFQALLVAGAMPSGTVSYHAAFEATA